MLIRAVMDSNMRLRLISKVNGVKANEVVIGFVRGHNFTDFYLNFSFLINRKICTDFWILAKDSEVL